MTIGSNGLRQGLAPRPIPTGPASLAAMIETLPANSTIALIDREGTLSYADLIAQVHAAAVGLSALGLRRGDMIAASSANVIELIVAFFAVQRLGAIWVGINRPLAAPEKATQLADCGARYFLGDSDAIAQVMLERERLPHLSIVRTLGIPDSDFGAMIRSHLGERMQSTLPDPFAPALIGYTSGTTGLPKGVVHSQHSVMAYLNACYASDEGGQWERGLRRTLPIPLTNPNGMIYGPAAALTGGGSFVAIDRSDAEAVCEWVERYAVDVLNTTPTTIRDMLSRPDLQQFRLSSLKAVAAGGSPPSVDLHRTFKARFGFELIADYGLTEAPSSVASTLPTAAPPAGATGKPHPHVRMAIMDPDANEMPLGAVGEVHVAAPAAGPWAGVFTGMLGYWGKPEETLAAFRGGWLRTGDMGCIDEAGYLTLSGRKKEMILRGGANIYPAEIEHVLRMHHKVNDAVVVGIPDERLGERVAAYVQLEEDVETPSIQASQLRDHCLAQIARYKVPERWIIVTKIPRNALNKPMRSLLQSTPQRELTDS